MVAWLHILALGTFFGATVLLLAFLSVESKEAGSRQAELARLLRVYDPVAIGALGVQIVTGAVALTEWKARLGKEFYAQLGSLLAGKLALVFLLVLASTYLCLGLGHRFVRAFEAGEPPDELGFRSFERRMKFVSALVLGLTAWIAWRSLDLP
ncbi:MAG: hypothetical protein KatS3mg076_1268 [Candidatus Binatia bacterium]|nr:MAG: hypothetical protein KatS3mg076_1268 [Candidatus Binatia bacterium]